MRGYLTSIIKVSPYNGKYNRIVIKDNNISLKMPIANSQSKFDLVRISQNIKAKSAESYLRGIIKLEDNKIVLQNSKKAFFAFDRNGNPIS